MMISGPAGALFREFQLTLNTAAGLVIDDIQPYLDKLGMTDDTILATLHEIGTSVSQRTLALYQMLKDNPGRKYSFAEMADAFGVANETARRNCYFLATLRLIRMMQAPAERSRRLTYRLYYTGPDTG